MLLTSFNYKQIKQVQYGVPKVNPQIQDMFKILASSAYEQFYRISSPLLERLSSLSSVYLPTPELGEFTSKFLWLVRDFISRASGSDETSSGYSLCNGCSNTPLLVFTFAVRIDPSLPGISSKILPIGQEIHFWSSAPTNTTSPTTGNLCTFSFAR